MAKWEWFATFTFRDRNDPRFPGWTQVGWKYAHVSLQKWHESLVMAMDSSNPSWVACMELQGRGVPHWHLLVGDVEDQRRMDWVDWWYENYGIARVLPYEEKLGARYYLGKYLTKEVAALQFSPLIYAKTKRS